MRTKFNDYLGLYVLHCHRLNHEDNGLMMLVNVIPAVSASGGGSGLARAPRDGEGLRRQRRSLDRDRHAVPGFR